MSNNHGWWGHPASTTNNSDTNAPTNASITTAIHRQRCSSKFIVQITAKGRLFRRRWHPDQQQHCAPLCPAAPARAGTIPPAIPPGSQPEQQPPLSTALWAPTFALKCLYFIALDYVDRPAFNTVFYRHYAGRPTASKHDEAQHIFTTYMLPKMLPGAARHIASLQAHGWTVVLVTGSLDHLMAPVAAHFNADAVIAATLEERDGLFTGELVGAPVVGEEKVRRMRADAAARGVTLDTCAAYSDSYSDLPMLRAVGAAHAVNPDARLTREAQEQGWPLFHW